MAGLFALVTLPLFIIFIGLAIITGHKFQIRKGEEIVKVKKVFDDLKDNIHDMTKDDDAENLNTSDILNKTEV